MKYHEKNDHNRFLLSLLFAAILVALVMVMPVARVL